MIPARVDDAIELEELFGCKPRRIFREKLKDCPGQVLGAEHQLAGAG